MSLLHDHHRKMLEVESGISPDIIAARGYRTITTKAELERLGFGRGQRIVPALVIPIFSPTGEVVLHQARPDEPRRNNKGKTVKYETPTGAQMHLDVPPASRPKLGDPKVPLFITEGVKKGDALASHKLCTVALNGVWNWRGTNEDGGKTALPEWEDVDLKGRDVFIVFDSDVMEKEAVHKALVRLKAFLELRGAKVKLIYLPYGEGAVKQGVDDYLVAGHDVNDLLTLATNEVRGLEADGEERAGPYRIRNGALCHRKPSRDGYTTVELCNFTARVVEERERDDGIERTLMLVIEGALSNGRTLPTAEVTASQFAGMNWPVSAWGTRAVVYAGQGTKDHLRTAVQMFSGDVPRRTTYTHLGWREIDGRCYFLHAGGVIGAPSVPDAPFFVQVEAPSGLERFVLPAPPTGDNLKRAVRASLDTLNLAPDDVSVPLLGATYRPLFSEVDFGVHTAGGTGNGKSELAAINQAHYGAGLTSRTLPGSWSSTPNALEGLAFAGKDVPVVVDDFAPEGSSHDIARTHATAARLFRAQGNSAARGRMNADGSLRPNKPPRGMILSTGEDIPKGHSIKARTLILELEPGALNWPRLTVAQRLAAEGAYAAATSGFIGWLAEDYKGRTATFRADHARFRTALQTSGHKRTTDAGAQLLATYRSLLTFAHEAGAFTKDEHDALWQRVEAGIKTALEPQAALQAQSDPVTRFAELLPGLLISGRAHVADARTGDWPGDGWGWVVQEVVTAYGTEKRRTAKGALIGWLDGNNLFLNPAVTYAELQKLARDQGDSLPVTERVLWKRLAERGVVVAAEDGHTTVKRTFPGPGRVRVLQIPTAILQNIGATGAAGEDDVQNEENQNPDSGQQETEPGQAGQHEGRHAQRPEDAPSGIGAANGSGARETPLGKAQTPDAPNAPGNTGVGVLGLEREVDTLSHLVGATEGEL